MHDSTLELFINNENTDDRDHMIDTMAETYWVAMHKCVEDNREMDAVAIYEEWIVDGVDPQDDDYVFIFAPDLTLETEEK